MGEGVSVVDLPDQINKTVRGPREGTF